MQRAASMAHLHQMLLQHGCKSICKRNAAICICAVQCRCQLLPKLHENQAAMAHNQMWQHSEDMLHLNLLRALEKEAASLKLWQTLINLQDAPG